MSIRYLICSSCPALNRIPLEKTRDSPRCGKCKQPLAVDPVVAVGAPVLDMALRSSSMPVIVDFWAPWCGPCRNFAPVFLTQAQREPTRALYLKVNTEEQPDLGRRFGIHSIPTLVAFAGGRERARQSGDMNSVQLREWLDRL